jgi:PTH2 family peptidyl-tRNA hydrolase
MLPVNFYRVSKYKLVIIVRTDLKMGKGKIAVQAGHASILAYTALNHDHPDIAVAWLKEGQFKVVVKAKSLSELDDISVKARAVGLPITFVHDFGLTQVEPNTTTCLAIGPCISEDVNKITKDLPLL